MATATTNKDQELDQYGNPVSKTSQTGLAANTPDTTAGYAALPTVAQNQENQDVNLSPDALQGKAAADLNTQVLNAAQQSVLNQPQTSDIQNATNRQTMNFINNPMGGYSGQQNEQAQLEAANTDWAKSFEGMRQQYGNKAGSGLLQQGMLENALQHQVDQSTLKASLEHQNYQDYLDAMSKAIGTGQDVAKTNADLYSKYLGNLGTVRGMAEGERAQTTGFQENVALTTLGFNQDVQKMAIQNGYDLNKLNTTYGLEMAKQIATQNWQGAQNDLDRQAAVAKQNNDIAAQQNLVKLQGSLDMERLNKTQDWQGVQNDLNRAADVAKQDKDIEAQSSIVDRQLALDKWKQENGQTFTAEQNALDRALQNSLKDKDLQGQQDLMNLKAKIDAGTLAKEQDFTASQSELDRQIKTAQMKGDWANAIELTNLKGTIDAAAQKNQQQYATAERVATQGWQTSERISEGDAKAAMQVLDYEHQDAMQAKDIEAQSNIEDKKAALELKLNTQNMDQQTKMAYLNYSLDQAKANGDITRQEQILTFQHGQEMETIRTTQGYTQANMYLENNLKTAFANNDTANQASLIMLKGSLDAAEGAKDRALEETRIALQGKQLDVEGQKTTFDELLAGHEAGTVSDDTLNAALQNATAKYGITVTAPDPDAYKKALDTEYKAQQYQWIQTHPDEPLNPDGTLKDATAFNQFVNDTVFGDPKINQYLSGVNPPETLMTDPDMQAQIAKIVTTWDFKITGKPGNYTFQTTPPKAGSYFNLNGVLYCSQSDLQVTPGMQTFMAMDVKTGKLVSIHANGQMG